MVARGTDEQLVFGKVAVAGSAGDGYWCGDSGHFNVVGIRWRGDVGEGGASNGSSCRVAKRGEQAECQDEGAPKRHCHTESDTVSVCLWLPVSCAGEKSILHQIEEYGMNTLSLYASLPARVAGNE